MPSPFVTPDGSQSDANTNIGTNSSASTILEGREADYLPMAGFHIDREIPTPEFPLFTPVPLYSIGAYSNSRTRSNESNPFTLLRPTPTPSDGWPTPSNSSMFSVGQNHQHRPRGPMNQ